MDLTLPPDLAKLPPLLDGTHTLLELSRESMAEPLRLGAFALFLREMGWARLHEMPPLDRHALDLALSPEPEPLSPPLAEPFLETVPSLFSTIQEAALPTTNLEHLSQALDQEEPRLVPPVPDPLDEPLYQPEALALPEDLPAPEPAGTGYPATPAMPIESLSEELEDTPLPLVAMDRPAPVTLSLPPEVEDAFSAPPAAPAPAGHGLRRFLLALLVLVCLGGAAGYLWHHRAGLRARLRKLTAVATQSKPVQPPTAPPPAPAPDPAPVPAAPQPGVAVPPVPAKPEAVPAAPSPAPADTPAKPATPKPAKPVPAEPEAPARPAPATRAADNISLSARLKALEVGDLELAVRQGRRLAKEVPPGHYTLRLEVACQGDTIRRVVELFKGKDPDIFLLPIAMRDGRSCYQVLYGRFPSEAVAEKQRKRLPASFLADRNRPKLFRFSDIPKHQ